MLKGEESFFYPYFQVISPSDLPMAWSENDLSEFQDQVLKTNAQNSLSDFEDEWLLIYNCIRLHESFFIGVSVRSSKELKAIF